MSNFFKQTGKSAKDAAIKTARQIVHEPAEILKNTKTQITGTPESQKSEMSVMQQIMTGDGKVRPVTSQEEQSINALAKNRLQQIEAELRQLRMQREQKSQEWIKEQTELMGGGKEEKPKTFVMPTSRPRRGGAGPGHKKQGTKEMGKQYSG